MIPACPAPDDHPRHSPEYVTHSVLTRWFDERCVTVRSLHLPDDKALELGEVTASAVEHDVCRELLVRLARRMKERSPKPVRIAREGLSERQTAEVRKLARRLADLGIVARAFQAAGFSASIPPAASSPCAASPPRDARSIGLIHGVTVTPASDLASVLVEATAPQGP